LHVAVTNISKATVNPYYGREIPGAHELGLDPERVYKLYRDPVELAKSAPTFARLQLLDTHVAVSADDPKRENWVGSLGSDVRFEHPYLKASLTVHDQSAIDNILAKKTAQLSSSYRYRADMSPGVSPEGVDYDGVMRDIIGNHVALVREGRAGPDVFVNDSLPLGLSNMSRFATILAVAASALALDEAQKRTLELALDKKAKDEENDIDEGAVDEREAACDEREESMDSAEAKADEKKEGEVARGDRKKARDSRKAARDKRASDRKAKDEAEKKAADEEKKEAESHGTGGRKAADSVSVVQATKLATDAAIAAVAANEAKHKAVRDVAPLVGPITVAMDSAEAVYRFALDAIKVPHKHIHASALDAVVAAHIGARKQKASPAFDASSVSTEHNISSIFGK
jgi:hypothetical protein